MNSDAVPLIQSGRTSGSHTRPFKDLGLTGEGQLIGEYSVLETIEE